MNLSAPILDVIPGPRGRALAALAISSRPLSMRELASRCGIAHTTASDICAQLDLAGLVTTSTIGRSTIASLNRSHIAVEAVLNLVNVRTELIRRMRQELNSWPNLHAAWIFGSAARGDGEATSDIDLMIIHGLDDDTFDEQCRRLSSLVQAWSGNRLEIVDHNLKSWNHLVNSKAAIVQSLHRDGLELIDGSRRHLRSGLTPS